LKGKLHHFNEFKKYLQLDQEITFNFARLQHYLYYLDLDHTNLLFQDLNSKLEESLVALKVELS
jgi:hypothetical protein